MNGKGGANDIKEKDKREQTIRSEIRNNYQTSHLKHYELLGAELRLLGFFIR